MAQSSLELERIRYWQGQLLASEDLTTQLRVDQELRRLHNHALHDSYGIAIGLELERDEVTGEIKIDSDENLNLICGLAYDCSGRELVLQSNRALPLPPDFPMTLVIRRDDNSIDGIALTWKRPRDINSNVEIAVTRLIEGLPTPKVDPLFRQFVARPLARPRIATGQTIPGQTTWQPWKIGDIEVGVRVRIDTSAGGFTRQPHYFAEVIPGAPTADFIPAWFASIADPSPQGFTFQLMLRRITREVLRIVDPKALITQRPEQSTILTLDGSSSFAANDLVARLIPLVENVSIIRTLTNQTATLDHPISDFTGSKLVALGNTRREALVRNLTGSGFFEVRVANPELFAAGNVVVKMNGPLASTRPGVIVAMDDEGTLELLPAVVGLVKTDRLGVVSPASIVDDVVSATEIKVVDASLYTKDDVVARLTEPIEKSAPATIVEKKAGNVLILSAPITDLKKGDSLGFARGGSEVDEVNDNSTEFRIEVDNVAPFRKHDLVAKSHNNGSFSSPVVVRSVFKNTRKLDLSGAIPGLALNDTIVACNFGIRTTVINVVTPTTLTVGSATQFPTGSYIAKIDELLKASIPVQVSSASGQTLTLTAPIQGLQAGDVLGLCTFPASVVVDDIRNDGAIEVRPAGLLQQGDLITVAPPPGGQTSLSLITNVTGNIIKVSGPLPGLNVNDRLSVAHVRGAVKAKHNTDDHQLIVEQPTRVREGDFLADITSWRQVQGSATVRTVTPNQLQLTAALDGALQHDIVGLASMTGAFRFFTHAIMQLRLEQSLELLVGDEVLLIGFDRLSGLTHTFSAFVVQITPDTKTILLFLVDAGEYTFRPEDIFASVLFVRGSSLALIQKHDLFVSWLAVGEPEAMPRPCTGTTSTNCECSQAKE
jgi:hypothetical protein